MKKNIYFLISIIFISICSCKDDPRFQVEGVITEAEGQMLYIEHIDMENITPLDSVKLDKKGNFSFTYQKPESPDFYRIRINNKTINFAVDSTELVEIEANYKQLPIKYIISGSDNNQKIKEITLLQINLQTQINRLVEAARTNQLSSNIFEDSVATLIKNYKDTIKINYIYSAPNKSYSYFALFQKINGYFLFDPLNNRDDIKSFAAVATSLNNAYPHADRSKNLYNIVIKGMKNIRQAQQGILEISPSDLEQTGIIDIQLKDLKGNIRKLSELKGKVVLLDFIIYQNAIATPHNFILSDLYKKYASQGLEIYQVSLDADEHFWKITTDELPWICVREPNGIYSPYMKTYNVQKLPAYFLIDRNNDLRTRDESIKDLEDAIKKLL